MFLLVLNRASERSGRPDSKPALAHAMVAECALYISFVTNLRRSIDGDHLMKVLSVTNISSQSKIAKFFAEKVHCT